jgi:hypothetical protein
MIWVRRILAIPPIIIFVILFIIVLVVTQVNSTVGSPGFYNDQMRQADIYNFIYDELLPTALDEIETDDSSDMPIDISDIKDDLISAARKILPPEWLQDQVESATNAIIPYFVGDTDYFTYTMVLKDRIEAAANIIKDDILHGDAFTSIYDDGMSYLADELFDELPSSLMLSKAEIEDSLRTVVSQGWIISQLEAAIDFVVPYMTGDSNHFTITINLQDIYTNAALLDLLGVGNEAFLDEARDWISEGWTFTDADLLDELDSDDQQTLEDVRGWIASGYTVTEADLREAISDTEEDFDFFDDARHWVGTGRTWLWALWLIPLIFLIAIGFLGGRSWKSRLAWALAVLFITSLTVYIATVVAYAAVGEPELQEIMLDPSEYEGIEAVMAEKGNEMIENVASGFVSGLKSRALYMTIGSAVVLLGVITWSVISRRRRPAGPSPDII